MPSWLGPFEIVLILGVGLLFFGSKRLPEMAKSFGQAIQEFKKVGKQVRTEVEASIQDDASESSDKPPNSPNRTSSS